MTSWEEGKTRLYKCINHKNFNKELGQYLMNNSSKEFHNPRDIKHVSGSPLNVKVSLKTVSR